MNKKRPQEGRGKQVSVRLPDALYERLKGVGEASGMSVNGVVVSSLWGLIDRSRQGREWARDASRSR